MSTACRRGCRTNQTGCTNLTTADFADLVRAAQAGRAGPPRRKRFTPESSPCRRCKKSRDTRWFTRQPRDEGVVRAQLWRRLRSGASKSRIPGLCLGAQRAFSKRTLRNLTHRGNACTSCRCRMGRDRCGPHRPRPRGIGSGMTARIHGRRSQAAHEPRAGTRSGRGRGTRSA